MEKKTKKKLITTKRKKENEEKKSLKTHSMPKAFLEMQKWSSIINTYLCSYLKFGDSFGKKYISHY